MKTKRDFFNASVDKSHLTFIRIGDISQQETIIGSKLLVGKVSDSRKFHVPYSHPYPVVVPFNLVDWNLVRNENKVYNFYYSLSFKNRRRSYK